MRTRAVLHLHTASRAARRDFTLRAEPSACRRRQARGTADAV